MHNIFLLALCLVLTALCASAQERCLDSILCVSIKQNGTNAIVTMRVTKAGIWGGFGIGARMEDADVWLAFNNNGNLIVQDTTSSSQSQPQPDNTPYITVSNDLSKIDSNGFTAVFVRPLAASGVQKALTPASAQSFIYAYGPYVAPTALSIHTSKSSFSANLFTSGASHSYNAAFSVLALAVTAMLLEL